MRKRERVGENLNKKWNEKSKIENEIQLCFIVQFGFLEMENSGLHRTPKHNQSTTQVK